MRASWARKKIMDLLEKIDKILVETTVVGGSYISGNTSITGSQQTRAVGGYNQEITIMQQKEKDNKLAVKFNNILGAYVPSSWQDDTVSPEEDKGDLE